VRPHPSAPSRPRPASPSAPAGFSPGAPSGNNGRVKLRIVAVVAFGAGYVLGSKAGHERYRQLSRSAASIGRSAPVQGTVVLAGDKARALASLGMERARDAVGSRLHPRDDE